MMISKTPIWNIKECFGLSFKSQFSDPFHIVKTSKTKVGNMSGNRFGLLYLGMAVKKTMNDKVRYLKF